MPFEKGHPKYGGRKKGTPNKLSVDFRAFARDLAKDEKYRANLMQRARAGKLAPQVEVLMLQYVAGKPTDTIELHATHRSAEQIAGMSDQELRARMLELAASLDDSADANEAEDSPAPADPDQGPEPAEDSSIH